MHRCRRCVLFEKMFGDICGNDGFSRVGYLREPEVEVEDVTGTDISDDEQLMVNNQTQTEAKFEKVPGADTSDEGSMVEVILEKKTPQHAP